MSSITPREQLELRLQLPHIELAARAWGPEDGRKVLAIHGWLDNAGSFEMLAPLLPGCRVVAIDLPGHGRSQHRPNGAWYHYVDYLHEVQCAAAALGWEKFTVLGHSLGAATASVFAAAAPHRVEAAWLIEGLGPLATPSTRALVVLREALAERLTLAAKTLRVFPTLDEAINARIKANGLSHAAASHLIERGTRAVEGGYVWSSDPRLTMTSAIRLTEEQILAYVAGIACPTLLILADPPPSFLPTEAIARRIECVAQLKVLRMRGSHHLHLEDPAPVAQAIREFAGL